MSRALIAGAGIGGLTAALALARLGIDVAIFERSRVLEEYGAGIQLSPNANRVLRRLDALGRVAKHALAPRAILMLQGRDDAQLARLPLGDADARWGAPFLVIHRARLQRALVERVARHSNIALRMGSEIAGFAADATGVSVGLRMGAVSARERGDLLVGADGLRSIVRERLGLGESGGAQFLGRVAFRALVDADSVSPRWREPEITLRLGERAHLVHYPLTDNLINIVAVIESGGRDARDAEAWNGDADLAALDRAFAKWSPDARALLARARGWRAWPLYGRPPLASFAAGRIALLGDAAHPMPPFLAQGAAQAIEDAGSLGEALGQTSDIVRALANYSAMRTARANRVRSQSSAQAKLYHMSGPLALARNVAMRALGPRRLLARYDWLYGG